MRKITTTKFKGTKNTLSYWWQIKNPLTVTINFLLIKTAGIFPSLTIRRVLLRLTGMKIEKNVSIGLSAMFDIFFPELITIKENTIIGYGSTILTHEFLIKEFRKGKVSIGKNVMIGANSTILPGTTIEDNVTISAMSLVNKDINANEFVGGIPVRNIKK